VEAVEKPFSRDSYLAGFVVLDTVAEDDAGTISSALTSMEPWRTLGYSRGTVQTYILRDDPALHRYLMRIDGAVAGAVFLRYPWLVGPYIELFAIFPAYQRRGAGRAILEWIEDESRGISRNLWALVSSFNTEARLFYRRMGFSEAAALTDLVKAGCDEILIRKPLRMGGT
jgi:diamine N-acetyltransferase